MKHLHVGIRPEPLFDLTHQESFLFTPPRMLGEVSSQSAKALNSSPKLVDPEGRH